MNTFYAIYNASGRILQCGSCPEEALSAQARPGEFVLAVNPDVNRTDFYVANDAAVAYTAQELDQIRTMPAGHYWKLPERIVVDDRNLDEARALKLAVVARQCDAELKPIKAGYPVGEQQTWDKQEREAREFVADDQTPTPMLTALAEARGITVADLAARVIVKADAFSAYSGGVIGRRQRCEDEIDAATNLAAVDAVTWNGE